MKSDGRTILSFVERLRVVYNNFIQTWLVGENLPKKADIFY